VGIIGALDKPMSDRIPGVPLFITRTANLGSMNMTGSEEETTLYQGEVSMREKADVPGKYTTTASMALQMKQRMRDGGFPSEAEYIRSLIRADLDAWATRKLSALNDLLDRPD
jgi:hypothetical protein